MINNKQRQDVINTRQAFKGNNSQGFYIGDEYIIKSYDTIIYSDSKGLNAFYYNHTSRVLQNQIKRAKENWNIALNS